MKYFRMRLRQKSRKRMIKNIINLIQNTSEEIRRIFLYPGISSACEKNNRKHPVLHPGHNVDRDNFPAYH